MIRKQKLLSTLFILLLNFGVILIGTSRESLMFILLLGSILLVLLETTSCSLQLYKVPDLLLVRLLENY